MNITDFLLARIEEDEADARQEDEDYTHTTLLPTYDSQHQARWNTERVLAECAAKREVVENLAMVKLEQPTLRELRGPLADVTLRQLAAVYRGHPDYQQEWAL